MNDRFDFESMDVYRVALEVARWVRDTRWPSPARRLQDEAARASQSMVLNIAEGRMRGGLPGRNHMRIARGSAGEVMAVLDLVALPEAEAQQAKLRRVGAMLRKLA